MNKFENVDVFSALNAIMKQNTGFYQSDFEIDKKIILRAAATTQTKRFCGSPVLLERTASGSATFS